MANVVQTFFLCTSTYDHQSDDSLYRFSLSVSDRMFHLYIVGTGNFGSSNREPIEGAIFPGLLEGVTHRSWVLRTTIIGGVQAGVLIIVAGLVAMITRRTLTFLMLLLSALASTAVVVVQLLFKGNTLIC